MSEGKGLLVTVLDLAGGATGSFEIPAGDYVLLCAEPAYIALTKAHANGTHVLTVKGYINRGPLKGVATRQERT